MIKVCPNKLMEYANRECNAIMTIAKCTNTAASSNDSNHHSSTPAAWFASGTAYHGRRYQNLRSWTSLRSYTIVDGMVFIYSTSLYIIYIAYHYNITQDAEREMHEVQYLYVAFP